MTMSSHKIFISYRRSDTAGTTGRLHDYLSEALGAENVFKDVQDIPAGVKFTEVLKDELQKCSIILVMIGKDYTTIKDDQGNLRLHDPNDFVQIEVATALESKKIVIPVLVNGASMPAADELPDNLKELVEYNAVVISHDRWKSDVDVLVKKLQHHIGPTTKKKTASRNANQAVEAASSATKNTSQRKWLVPGLIGIAAILAVIFLLPGLLGDDYEGDDFESGLEAPVNAGKEDNAGQINYRELLVGLWGCYQYGEKYDEGATLFTDVYYETGNVYLENRDLTLDYMLDGDVITWYNGDNIDRTIEIKSLDPSGMELSFADEDGTPIIARYRKLKETF